MPGATKWIDVKGRRNLLILTEIVSQQQVLLKQWKSTYRDDFDYTPPTYNAGTAAASGAAAGVPVFGDDGAQVVPAAFTSVKYRAPDKVAHVRPRFYWSYDSAVVFLKTGDVMPEPVVENFDATSFTAATSDVCTAAAHPFETGDLVVCYSTISLPGGLVDTLTYELVKLSDDTFSFWNSGAVVNITSIGSGTHKVARSVAVLDANTFIYPYVLMEDKPLINDIDPRLPPVTL